MTSGKVQEIELVIITGLSGSGKHTAFKAFEDLGYFCVDNLPTALVPRLLEMAMASGGRIDKLAIVVDVRLGEPEKEVTRFFGKIKTLPVTSTVLFFEATDEVLTRRYSETRRVHPLARDSSPLDGFRAERKELAEVRALADLIIDTTDLSVHELRNIVLERFRDSDKGERMNLLVLSFGFKNGIPVNSDLVFDVRFLPNPNFVPELKSKTGMDSEVIEYMGNFSETREIIDRLEDMLEYLLPRYVREGKSYCTLSIGCTGGRHRSVMIASEIADRMRKREFRVNLVHRDIHRE